MAHEFAFYIDNLSGSLNPAQSLYTIQQEELFHRLHHVLRVEPGDTCILFDRMVHVEAVLQRFIGKKGCEFAIESYKKNTRAGTTIVALLPILKKEHFEQAYYTLVEFGVTVIQPVVTEKIHRSWGGAKEKERLHKIMVAAAEQSKHFAFPALLDPIMLAQAADYTADVKLFCDPDGVAMYEVIMSLHDKNPTSIACIIGPEGDLTHNEKRLLHDAGFMSCALTSTILRSYQAIGLIVGMLRVLRI